MTSCTHDDDWTWSLATGTHDWCPRCGALRKRGYPWRAPSTQKQAPDANRKKSRIFLFVAAVRRNARRKTAVMRWHARFVGTRGASHHLRLYWHLYTEFGRARVDCFGDPY